MWISRTSYDNLIRKIVELEKEIPKKPEPPLPKYNVLFTDGSGENCRDVEGIINWDQTYVSFTDKDYRVTATFLRERFINAVEVKSGQN